MARPTKVDKDVADAIAYLYRPGLSTRDLAAQLAQAGMTVSHATVARYLARVREDGAPVPPPAAPDASPADEVTGLEAQLRHVDAGLAAYGASLPSSPADVRAYKALVELKTKILASIAELTPRQTADEARALALGEAARAELLERARAAARTDEDLRGRVQRQGEVIADLLRRTGT